MLPPAALLSESILHLFNVKLSNLKVIINAKNLQSSPASANSGFICRFLQRLHPSLLLRLCSDKHRFNTSIKEAPKVQQEVYTVALLVSPLLLNLHFL